MSTTGQVISSNVIINVYSKEEVYAEMLNANAANKDHVLINSAWMSVPTYLLSGAMPCNNRHIG